jgi:hypothetical protein
VEVFAIAAPFAPLMLEDPFWAKVIKVIEMKIMMKRIGFIRFELSL